jgi:parvulin-like peptidyl-prolyl isomerase
MTAVLEVANRTITAAEIIPLLTSYRMLPQLMRESIIDQAIASINCTPEETASACEQFYRQNQLTSETKRQAWLGRHGMSSEHLETLATRGLRIEKFKQATWERKLEAYFLKRKGQLDKAIYSLMRTKDLGLAQELYFRIQEGEQTFAEVVQEFSPSPEAQAGGVIGPVELSTLHPMLARLLAVGQPGQLWPPFAVGEWLVIVRKERLLPARLDEPMRQRLLNELFETWLQEQLSHQSHQEQVLKF